jgi:Asp-tRNA(Asn)/Glu-tRNA(Gln) amidotransferase A subunit family amidase
VTADLTELAVADLGPKLAAREVSPVELTEAYLGRIEALNGQIHAYVNVTADRARSDAKAAEAELQRHAAVVEPRSRRADGANGRGRRHPAPGHRWLRLA